MRELYYFFKQLASQLHLRWIAHYSRVTGKPAESGLSFTLYTSIFEIAESIWDNANTSNDIFFVKSVFSGGGAGTSGKYELSLCSYQ